MATTKGATVFQTEPIVRIWISVDSAFLTSKIHTLWLSFFFFFYFCKLATSQTAGGKPWDDNSRHCEAVSRRSEYSRTPLLWCCGRTSRTIDKSSAYATSFLLPNVCSDLKKDSRKFYLIFCIYFGGELYFTLKKKVTFALTFSNKISEENRKELRVMKW